MSAFCRACCSLLLSLAVFLGGLVWARAEERSEGSLVTFSADKLLLSKALAEIQKQTGIVIEDRRGEADTEVRLPVKQGTFWQAADAVAAAAGGSLYLYPREGRVALIKRLGMATAAPVSYSGIFRIVCKRIMVAEDLETGSKSCTGTFEVAWEPQRQLLFLDTHPQNLVVREERGAPVPVVAAGSSLMPVDGRMAAQFECTLPVLPRSAGRIGSIHGQLMAVGASKMLTFSFPSMKELDQAAPAAPVTLSQEKVVCQVRKVLLKPDRWSVTVGLTCPPGGARLESYQSWVVNNDMALELLGRKQRLKSTNYVLEDSSPRQAVVTYHFLFNPKMPAKDPAAWKLVYTTPAAIVEMTIPFAFKDIPLP